jgi:hypothetical protein
MEKLLSDLKVPFMISANISTGKIERFGDSSSIQPADLVSGLFGDAEALAALNESLEGQSLPRSFGQGDIAAVLCKPKPDVIVGLFYKVTLGPVENYHLTMRLCEAVNSAWH